MRKNKIWLLWKKVEVMFFFEIENLGKWLNIDIFEFYYDLNIVDGELKVSGKLL